MLSRLFVVACLIVAGCDVGTEAESESNTADVDFDPCCIAPGEYVIAWVGLDDHGRECEYFGTPGDYDETLDYHFTIGEDGCYDDPHFDNETEWYECLDDGFVVYTHVERTTPTGEGDCEETRWVIYERDTGGRS